MRNCCYICSASWYQVIAVTGGVQHRSQPSPCLLRVHLHTLYTAYLPLATVTYIHTIHQTIHLLLKDSNLPKTSRALSKCAYTCAHCRPMIDGLNHFFMRHLSLFYNKIADNLRLGRARIAAVENQVWWTVLPPSLYRILSSMDWQLRPMVTTIGHHPAQRPHPLIYKAQIWGARSSCINLPTGSKTRAIFTPIDTMQPSNNVRCPIIDWLFQLVVCCFGFVPCNIASSMQNAVQLRFCCWSIMIIGKCMVSRS